MTTQNAYRLSDNIRPTNYDLRLTPNLDNFTFLGEEIIVIEVSKPIDRITVNATELEILGAQLTTETGVTATPEAITLDDEYETVSFVFKQPVEPGTMTLSIQFNGTLNDQLRGFYRSHYTNPEGVEQTLATTQFEATDARRAFPCWDDPAVKAKFKVTLVIPENLVAISNTPIESETPEKGGTKAIMFAETPKMSTYLLAFIVGDFASVEQMAPNGTLVRVWATRGKEEQGRFAMENAVGLLNYFNSYFGIPYPLPKLDHIAIPDFAAGAMENWGAITYRETALLYDPQNSSASTRQRIMEVVSHEMAHMWFGDLVTMEWWNDLWLNESFASWMGDKAVDHQYPEWNMWTQFVFQDTNSGLSLDGLRNSHPIEAKVENPAQIRELFDAISYSKGGATLRMLEDFLGADLFQKGLQEYISANQYGNARTEDLWKALDNVSGQPVTDIMNTWVKQTGYPVIQCEYHQHGEQLHVELSQSRFLYDNLLEEGNDPTLWQVPYRVIAPDTIGGASGLISSKDDDLTLTNPTGDNDDYWIKLNGGQTGFYRVNYSPEGWSNLRSAIEEHKLPAVDRLGIQNDAYALARGGYLPATDFLSIIEAYKNEVDSSVWSDLATNLRGMENLLSDEPWLTQFRNSARILFSNISKKVGWEPSTNEGHLDSILRTVVLGQAGSYGDQEVIGEAQRKFGEFLNDPSSVHPDLRGVVYGLVAQEGDQSAYDTLWDLEQKATLHEERMRILGALTRFQNPDLLGDLLHRSMSEDVRSQDSVLVIVSIAGNRLGKSLAWDFIRDNWGELDRRYGRGGFAIMRLVGITGAFTTLERADEVEAFFKNNPAPSAQRTIQQALERIRLNARWLELNREGLKEWFDKNTYS